MSETEPEVEVEENFDRWPVTGAVYKHERPDGKKSGGYFCMQCGAPCINNDPDHGGDKCGYNPVLVTELRRINGW